MTRRVTLCRISEPGSCFAEIRDALTRGFRLKCFDNPLVEGGDQFFDCHGPSFLPAGGGRYNFYPAFVYHNCAGPLVTMHDLAVDRHGNPTRFNAETLQECLHCL